MRLYSNAFKQGISRIFTLPRLSLPLVSTLGLTLAAVLTVVAVANTLLFQPLPDVDEQNLYRIDLQLEFSEGLTVPFFSDPRRVAALKQQYGAELQWGHVTPGDATVDVSNNKRTVTSFSAVSGSPEVLGLPLLQGQSSEIDNAEEGVWISQSLWRSAFNQLTDLSSQTLRLDGVDYPIFGVFEDFVSINDDNFAEQNAGQVWRFRDLDRTLDAPDSISLNLGPITFVRGERAAIPTPDALEAWFEDYVNTDITIDRARDFLKSKPLTGEVLSFRDDFIGDSQQLVFLLMIATVSLLVMACLNLLNMFIAHYQSRNKEFSIQICMGSSLAKLRGLIFAENLPMFLVATVLGLLAAGWLVRILPTLAGDNLPLLGQISLDLNSILVALLIVALINFVFSVIALVYVDKKALTDSLNSSGKGTPAQQKQAISKALMVVQLTLACVLLTAASASVKDSYHNTYTDLGYSMPNAYEVSMQVNDEQWQESLFDIEEYRGSELQQLRGELLRRLGNLGGDVIDIQMLPLSGEVRMRAYPDPETGNSVMVRSLMWGQGMLPAFDIELLAGRDMTPEDVGLANVIVAKSFAIDRAGESEWRSLVGTELKMGEEAEDIFNIVGIVEDVYPLPTGAINVDAPEIYFSSPVQTGVRRLSAVVIMPEGQVLQSNDVELALSGLDSRLVEIRVDAMHERWQVVTEATRLNMYVVMGLAGLTLVLAAIGVSGLSQMTGSQKRYELAVRMATGAKQSKLLLLLLKDSLWMLIVGLGLGVLAATSAYHYLLDFFESAPAFDWLITATINSLLATVMLISIAVPGWAVIRKDPMRALREL